MNSFKWDIVIKLRADSQNLRSTLQNSNKDLCNLVFICNTSKNVCLAKYMKCEHIYLID